MIHLDKPNETPPVLLNRGTARTQRDCEAYAENPAAYGSGELKLTFIDRIYGSTEVREVLGILQYNKCCYCERKTSGRMGAFPISRSRAHTHRRHGHPLQTVPSAGLIERPQEKNRVDALR